MTPLAVYDCMIHLQAASNPHAASGECVRRAVLGDVQLFLSLEVLAEVRDVLTRPRTLKKFPHLTPAAVNTYLRTVGRFGTVLPDPPHAVSLPRDPNDEKYLNLAVAAGATVIVSRDNDLLDLMNPTNPDGVAFRTVYPTIAILDPAAFLATLPTA